MFFYLVASARVEPEIHWSKHLNQCLGRPQEMFECVVERSEVRLYSGIDYTRKNLQLVKKMCSHCLLPVVDKSGTNHHHHDL